MDADSVFEVCAADPHLEVAAFQTTLENVAI